jgi:hypothetical protein
VPGLQWNNELPNNIWRHKLSEGKSGGGENMTYRELKEKLEKFTEEQLDSMDVTILVTEEDEYYPLKNIIYGDESVLDKNHPVLVI